VILMHFTADPTRRPECEERWRDEVTGEMVNWFEKYFMSANRSIRARQYNLSFEASSDAPAFPEFRKEFHTASGMEPLEHTTVHIGMDLGEQNPAAIIWQFDPDYRLLVLDELWPPFPSFNQFMQELAYLLGQRYQGLPVVVHPDPTGGYQTGADYYRIIRDVYGLELRPPPKITDARFRMRIVQQYLRQASKGRPFLCIDTRCKTLIDAFTHGYRMKTNRDGRVTDRPLKDGLFEHGMDALTYSILATSHEVPEQFQGIGAEYYHPDPTGEIERKKRMLDELMLRKQRGRWTYAR